MDLSPNDIRNYEFPNQMRGYDKEAVDSFLEQVAAALEAAKQEQLKLSMELDSVKSQLTGLKQFEETIKNAAIDARRNADSLIASAKQEADELLSKARTEASEALEVRTQQVGELEEQITKVGLTRKSYLSKIRSLIQSHLDMINEIEQGEEPEGLVEDLMERGESPVSQKSEDDIEVTDSNEVDRKSRETIATQPGEQEAIRAEEANAPEGSIEGLSQASKEDLSEALKDVLGDEEQGEETGPIDPELAAALENYKKTAAEQAEADQQGQPEIPPQGVMQETTARAEDIPEGFITPENEQLKQDTDKMQVSESGAESQNEPNRVNVNSQGGEESKDAEPEALAKNLDEVAAKFEEEMDRAEQR